MPEASAGSRTLLPSDRATPAHALSIHEPDRQGREEPARDDAEHHRVRGEPNTAGVEPFDPSDWPPTTTATITAAPNATSIAVSSTIVATIVTTLDPGTCRRTTPTRSASPTRAGKTASAPIALTKAPNVVRNRRSRESWA